MKQKTAIIIGAGYSGVALANLLAKSGYEVTVYEKNAQAGGRISLVKQDGFTFDLGPSWYLMPEVFEQYYSLFGRSATKDLSLVRFKPGYRVFFKQQPSIDIQGELESDSRTFERLEPHGAKKLQRYINTSTLAYTTATKYFLYSNFQRLGDFIKAPILKASPKMLSLVFRPLHNYVSSQFKDSRLQKILEYHMVFLGSSPFQAPALYTLMSHLDFQSGIYYPKRGMYTLIDSLLEISKKLKVSYHFNTPVEHILIENKTAVGVQLKNGAEVRADVVVSAGDLHHTETQLLEPRHQTYPETYWKKRQPGPSSLLISLGIKGVLPQLVHHNLFLVDDWRENFSSIYETKQIPKNASIYICNPTKTDPKLAPKGHENIFILVPLAAGVNYTTTQINNLTKRVITQFASIIHEPQLQQRIVSQHIFTPADFGERFNAWELNAFGGESHLLRQSVIFRTSNKSKKVKNLYYVGAGSLPGIGLPMCLISAQLTYKRIVGIKTGGPLQIHPGGDLA